MVWWASRDKAMPYLYRGCQETKNGFLKTKFNIPIVVSLRGAHINYTPIVKKQIAQLYIDTFSEVDQFHAVSNAIAREASKYGDILSKTQVIHSPIPDYFFKAFIPY